MNKEYKLNFLFWTLSKFGGTKIMFEVANYLANYYKINIFGVHGNSEWFTLNKKVKIFKMKKTSYLKAINVLFPQFKRIYNKEIDWLEFERIISKITNSKFLYEKVKKRIEKFDDGFWITGFYQAAYTLSLSSKPFLFYVLDFPESVKELCNLHLSTCYNIFLKTLNLENVIYVALSKYVAEIIRKYNKNEEVKIIYPAVDHKIFKPVKMKMFEEVKELKIMLLTYWQKWKQTDFGIKILNQLNKKIKIFGILAGSLRGFRKIKNKIQFNYVYYPEPSDKLLAKLYSSADFFLFPSKCESFGLPILEAMACKTIPIHTSKGAPLEFTKDGVNSFIMLENNPKNIAEKILKLKQYDLENIRKNAFKTSKKFNWEKTGKKIKKLIKGVK